jgi:hypothetical protein
MGIGEAAKEGKAAIDLYKNTSVVDQALKN